MRRPYLTIITMAVAALVLASVSAQLLGTSHSEAQVALAYACGYRNGQLAITSQLPSLLTDPRDMAGAEFKCAEEKAIARKHGFDQ